MNKKLIALAIAASMAAPMAANAAPKLYGALQAEITDYDRSGATSDVLEIDDIKRGRLGVKGSEDLGGGLKGIYKFEWQVDTSDADSNDGTREAFIGLKGGFGEFKMGALKSPYKYIGGVKYDPFVATAMEARGNGGMLKAEGTIAKNFGSNSFLNNAMSYKGKFGMATVWAAYRLSETEPDHNDLVLGVKFNVSKAIEFGFAHADEDTGTSTTGGTRTKAALKLKFGMWTGAFQVESQDSNATNGDAEAVYMSHTFKFGKTSVVANYGVIDSDTASADVDYIALGVIHKFTKKARVYAGYRSTDGDTNNALDVDALTAGMRIDF